MRQFHALALAVGLAACVDTPTAPTSIRVIPIVPAPRRDVGVEPITGKYVIRFRADEPNAAVHAHLLERTHGAVVERVYTSAIKGASVAMAEDAAEALKA